MNSVGEADSLKYVENGVPEDFAKLCFKGMTVPLCELSEEEYMEIVYGIKGYKVKAKRGGGYTLQKEDKPEEAKLYGESIDILDLSIRASNGLLRAGIKTIGELCQLTEPDVRRIRNMGEKSVREVKSRLADFNLALKETCE